MSFRVISLFRCAVEVITGHDSLTRVEHHSSDLFCRRRFARNSVGKVGAILEGEGIIGKHRDTPMNPVDDDTRGSTSRHYFIRSTIYIVDTILHVIRGVTSAEITCPCKSTGTREIYLFTFYFSPSCGRSIANNAVTVL
jgi:hypothetical protein